MSSSSLTFYMKLQNIADKPYRAEKPRIAQGRVAF